MSIKFLHRFRLFFFLMYFFNVLKIIETFLLFYIAQLNSKNCNLFYYNFKDTRREREKERKSFITIK